MRESLRWRVRGMFNSTVTNSAAVRVFALCFCCFFSDDFIIIGGEGDVDGGGHEDGEDFRLDVAVVFGGKFFNLVPKVARKSDSVQVLVGIGLVRHFVLLSFLTGSSLEGVNTTIKCFFEKIKKCVRGVRRCSVFGLVWGGGGW